MTATYRGLKVLDFSWAAAGPVVTTFLAFLGADVVKVENSARPDLMRVSDRQYGYRATTGINESPLFNELASGKRSIELDLTEAADLALAVELASVADVVVENMRPGKSEKLGLSYPALVAQNPALIMCSVSATGRSRRPGPPGYASIFWAEGGGAWLTGWPHRPPGLVRGPVDLHAAAFACLGILSLLRRRARTGEGGYIDCSAVEAVAAAIGVHLVEAQLGLGEAERRGNAGTSYPVNDVYPCAGEDQWIAITLTDQAQVRVFVEVMAREFGATLTAAEVDAGEDGWKRIAAVTEAHGGERLETSLQEAGLAASRSMSLRDALTDPRLTERGALQEIVHPAIGPQVIAGLPWNLDGHSYPVGGPAPDLGADRDSVLRDWLARTSP
jgi:benzylsuccinate CoA-transferase BbsF subunit